MKVDYVRINIYIYLHTSIESPPSFFFLPRLLLAKNPDIYISKKISVSLIRLINNKRINFVFILHRQILYKVFNIIHNIYTLGITNFCLCCAKKIEVFCFVFFLIFQFYSIILTLFFLVVLGI
jgi:hypothetical protein